MPTLPPTPGVYVEEGASTPRVIDGSATSVAAFLGTARRGPVYTPVRVRSLPEHEATFGGLLSTSELGYAVRHFFENGGTEAVIVRVHEGAQAAAAWKTFGGVHLRFVASSPGAWGDALRLRVEASDSGFDLTVLTVGDDGRASEVERFRSLSSAPTADRYVGAVLAAGSQLLRVDPNPPAPPATATAIEAPDAVALTGGADGDPAPAISRYDGSVADAPGVLALDAVAFNLLCVPFPTTAAPLSTAARLAFWSQTAIPYCEKRRAMAIIDGMPDWMTAADVLAADRSPLVSPFAALYAPNVRGADPIDDGRLRDFPPCGVVAGVIARTDAERGVWRAPAGIDATLAGVIEVTFDLTDAQQATFNREGVNALRTFTRTGPVVWGARTTAGADPSWKHLPVRRLASFVEVSVQHGTHWAVFEPNDEALWSTLRLTIGSFLHALFRQGAFAGSTPEASYFVKCGRETTTQADIDSGVVIALIGLAPLRPAEFTVHAIQVRAGAP